MQPRTAYSCARASQFLTKNAENVTDEPLLETLRRDGLAIVAMNRFRKGSATSTMPSLAGVALRAADAKANGGESSAPTPLHAAAAASRRPPPPQK